jgi:hypothetical protein
MRFRLTARDSLFEVGLDQEGVRYELLEGGPIEIYHHDEAVLLEQGKPMRRNGSL